MSAIYMSKYGGLTEIERCSVNPLFPNIGFILRVLFKFYVLNAEHKFFGSHLKHSF
jgi:hypothetical protein